MKMDLADFFKKVARVLKDSGAEYALAGGLVASIYRVNERTTNDVDFLILAKKDTRGTAASIIKRFKLKPHVIRKANLEGGPMFAIKRNNTTPFILAGRTEDGIGLDFILPEMPWFASAIERAGHNRIDFGFGPVPCLTKEDVIISKFYSLKNDKTRFNDLDDLKSIFLAGHEFDLAYLCGQMQALKLPVPGEIKDMAPKAVLMASKRIAKEMRMKSHMHPKSNFNDT